MDKVGETKHLVCIDCEATTTIANFRGPYGTPFKVRCTSPTCGRENHCVIWEIDNIGQEKEAA